MDDTYAVWAPQVDNGDLLETNDDALEDVVYSTFQRWGLLVSSGTVVGCRGRWAPAARLLVCFVHSSSQSMRCSGLLSAMFLISLLSFMLRLI